MAITAAQRSIALQALVSAAINGSPTVPSGTPLTMLLPGTTAAELWAILVAVLGTEADASFTATLANLVTLYNQQLTTADANVAALQAEITAATII